MIDPKPEDLQQAAPQDKPKRRFFIDTDPGTDDAVALVMALQSDAIEVVGISVVAGNVGLEQTVQNALYTVEICGGGVPVYVGAKRPMNRELQTADLVHGKDGLGDIGLPLTGRIPASASAVDALIEAARQYAGELTLVTLGPLTNVAQAVQRDPSFATNIARCVIMGGAPDGVGNTTATAEFNVFVDPEAAHVVLHSGMPTEWVGWDVTLRHAMLTPEENDSLRAHGTPLAEFVADIQKPVLALWDRLYGYPMVCLPDPLAMAVALTPDIAEYLPVHMDIEVSGSLTVGMTVVDRRPRPSDHNALIVTRVHRDRFMQMLHDAVS
ncbi:MAG: nucleoside hydrolase [Chloroflexi bacterium]|nr:nucleoside hydrolase [Chloroflexota bacterium]